MILVGIVVVIVGGELLLPAIEEGVMLLLETLELAVETLFEEMLDFTPEESQQATAWTGLFVLIALLIWGGFRLKALYLRAKIAAPAWLAARVDEFKTWWHALPWTQKLSTIFAAIGLLGLLILFI